MKRRDVVTGSGILLFLSGIFYFIIGLSPPDTPEYKQLYSVDEEIEKGEEWYAEVPVKAGETIQFDIDTETMLYIDITAPSGETVYAKEGSSIEEEFVFDSDGDAEIRVKGSTSKEIVNRDTETVTISPDERVKESYTLRPKRVYTYTLRTPADQESAYFRISTSDGGQVKETLVEDEVSETFRINSEGEYVYVLSNPTESEITVEYVYIEKRRDVTYSFTATIRQEE
jgi:hypothetical protein